MSRLRSAGTATIRRVAAALAVVAMAVVFTAAPAAAHEPGTTSIELQIDADELTAQIDVDVDLLEVALDTDLPTDPLSLSANRDLISGYLTDHFAVGEVAGDDWAESIGTLTSVRVDGVDVLRLMVDVDPAGEVPDTFVIAYDGVLESDDSHLAYVTATGLTEQAGLVGVIDQDTPSLSVDLLDLGEADTLQESGDTFTAMISQGFTHVLDGADHLLFLLVLLLPAPLALQAGRWREGGSGRTAMGKVLVVATAFFVGHSITLMASAFGWITLPGRPVEILVAASVAVAAVHALRPLTARGEPLIAGGFGLIHGLAFSTLLKDLSLGQTTSLVSLVGFNLGVELAQLVFILCVFPSLWLLSRTSVYPWVRMGGAGFALALSTAWVVERLLVVSNPLTPVESLLIDRLWLLGVLLALGALVATTALRRGSGAGRRGHGQPQLTATVMDGLVGEDDQRDPDQGEPDPSSSRHVLVEKQ